MFDPAALLWRRRGSSALLRPPATETSYFDDHPYWRNARTLASHNPAIQRERAIGDYWLNGTPPVGVLQAVIQSEAQAKNAADLSGRNP